MNPECIAAVNRAAGRTLSDGEIEGIQRRLLNSMKVLAKQDPAAWRALSPETRYLKGAEFAKANMQADMTRQHAQAIRDMALKVRNNSQVDADKPGLNGKVAGMLQRLAWSAKGGGGDTSAEMLVESIYKRFMSQLNEVDGGGKLGGLIQDPAKQLELLKAIKGEPVNDPSVAAAGKAVQKVMKDAFDRMNEVGIHINELEDYFMPHAWDWATMGDRKQVADDMEAEINHSAYIHSDGTRFSPAEIRAVVESSVATLATKGANKQAEGVPRAGSRQVGGGRNAPRQLHFKTAEGYAKLMKKYGRAGNIEALLSSHFHGVARDIATAERYGRDADAHFSQLLARAFEGDSASLTDKKQREKLEKLRHQTLKTYQAFRNPGAPGSLPLWAQISQTARTVISSTLVGSSLASSIPDMAMLDTYGRTIGLHRADMLRHMKEAALPTKDRTRMIERYGAYVHSMQQSAHRYATEEIGGRFNKVLNNAMHVAQGLRWYDRTQVHAGSASVMDMLGRHTMENDWNSMNAADKEYLTKRGVTQDHFDTWRAAELDHGPSGGSTMLTPDGIAAIPDEPLRALAERRISAISDKFKKAAAKRNGKNNAAFEARYGKELEREISNLRNESMEKLLSISLHESRILARGAMGNSLADQVRNFQTPEMRGTLQGELWAWLLFLKQTPLGIFRTHMLDVPAGMEGGAMGASAWRYRAAFAAKSAILGAMAVTAKSLLNGNDPQNLLTKEGAARLAVASGSGGMYADLFFGDSGDHNNGALTKLLGPGATSIEDAINLFHETASEADGSSTLKQGQYSAKMLRFARNYAMPFTRLFYVKAAFNHLVYQNAQEALAPGYNARVRQRMAKYNQTSWWPSGSNLPKRAPDMKTVVGQ